MHSLKKTLLLTLLGIGLCTSLGGCFFDRGGGGYRRRGGDDGGDDDGMLYRKPVPAVQPASHLRAQRAALLARAGKRSR